jgi:DNA-binding response OmpR family regulator
MRFEMEDTATRQPSVMIVDDTARNIQVLAAVLDTAGYKIAAASDGRQALDMMEAVAPDLVLLDVMMPGMDGFEVCRKMMFTPATATTPVILLTARTAPEDIAQGFACGAVDYVTKPFNARELLARVKTHVRLRIAKSVRSRQIAALKKNLTHIHALSGLLPICSQCKKIRSDEGYWQQLEVYISDHCDAKFSHGICPDCVLEHYAEYAPDGCAGASVRPATVIAAPEGAAGGVSGPSSTILIVDDVPKNLQVLGNLLKANGYRVAAAIDAAQATTMIKEIPPDLILLDVVMPNMDGLTLCGVLKAAPATAHIPIIMLTARTGRDDIAKGFESGAEDYVTKPFNTAELLSRVKTHLGLKRIRDEQTTLIQKLEASLAQLQQLSILIPICSHCNKVRDDEGYWQQVEDYISSRSEAQFSHGVCPECRKKNTPP